MRMIFRIFTISNNVRYNDLTECPTALFGLTPMQFH